MTKTRKVLFSAALILLTANTCFAQQESLFKDLTRGAAKPATGRSVSPPVINNIRRLAGNVLTIKGQNLTGARSVNIGGTPDSNFVVNDAQTITTLTRLDSVNNISVALPHGIIRFNPAKQLSVFIPDSGYVAPLLPAVPASEPETAAKGSADFTIPEVGQSNLNIIVTPTFTLSRNFYEDKIAVSGMVWGNNFGLDSLKSTLGTKMLLPQSSMFGMNFSFLHIIGASTKVAAFGIAADLNLLYKKVGFLDTGTRVSTTFNPFVIHPKIGVTAAFFDSAIQLSCFYNLLTVQSENENFKKFFVTDKKAFLYPEFNLSGVFFVDEAQKQTIKVGINMIINNTNAKLISGSTDNIIPYLKIGLVSKL